MANGEKVRQNVLVMQIVATACEEILIYDDSSNFYIFNYACFYGFAGICIWLFFIRIWTNEFF